MAAEINESKPSVVGKPYWTLTSDKFKAVYTLAPTIGGFVFYEFTVNVGKLPAALSGMYTDPKKALDEFKLWEMKQPKSQAVKRDTNAAERAKRKEQTEA